MDVNLVLLAGNLAAPPEHRKFQSGSSLVRSLVTVRSDAPRRRVDVVPVTLWDPAADHDILRAETGDRMWVVGTVQRRFWSTGEDRKSRLEIVAHHAQKQQQAHTATDATGDLGSGVRLEGVD